MKKPLIVLIGFAFLVAISARAYSQTPTLTAMEQLGKSIFFDKISSPDNQSCADCHAPKVGFTGPNPAINKKGAVYMGAVAQRFGNRKPPASAYAGDSPILYYDGEEGVWVGGMFWDGRATGWTLGDPLAEQAQGPFLNPLEQNNADAMAVLTQIYYSDYAYLWELAWGEELILDPLLVTQNYERVARAVAAYERSEEVNPFTSKYDYFLAGEVELTGQESWGLELFNGKGMCNACHLSEGTHALFTDFTYDNLGVPKNPENPFYNMPPEFNPLGEGWIDLGLGGFLQSAGYTPEEYLPEMGKFKVPTLRNADLRPGNGFTKAYMHNGALKSLKEVVHFYNTRDVEAWPAPEYAETVNHDELGDLGLTNAEENAIVAFMKTLSDGYILPKTAAVEEVAELALSVINPVTSATNLTFFLPETSNVRIDIYSISGSQVAILTQKSYSAGINQVLISPDNFTPGIYIIHMNALGKEIIKKIMIL
jgi:cytochrome c peroxidase